MSAGTRHGGIAGIDFGRKLPAVVEVDSAGCLLFSINKHGPEQRIGGVKDKNLFVPCQTLDDLEDTAIVNGGNVWNLRRNIVDICEYGEIFNQSCQIRSSVSFYEVHSKCRFSNTFIHTYHSTYRYSRPRPHRLAPGQIHQRQCLEQSGVYSASQRRIPAYSTEREG